MQQYIFYIFIALMAAVYAGVRYYRELVFLKSYPPHEYELTLLSVKQLFSEFLTKRLTIFFIFIFLFALVLFFIRRDFSFIMFYGSILFFVFLSIDVFISLSVLKILYPFAISQKEYMVRDIFLSSKFFSGILLYSVLLLLYLRKGINFDYPVIFLGGVFLSFLIYSTVEKRYSKILYFITSSSISLMMILTLLFGLRYLMPSDVRFVFNASIAFFILALINEVILVFLPAAYRRYYFRVLPGLLLTFVYPILLFYMAYKHYSNLFFVTPAVIGYLSALFIFTQKNLFERYNVFISFFLIIFFFFMVRMFYIFNTSMNYERFIIFNIMLLIPFFYQVSKCRDYDYLYYFIKDNFAFEKMEFDLISLKKMFILPLLLSGLGFKIAYDYVVLYMGYSDTYSFFSVIIPIFFFYVFEFYSDRVVSGFSSIFQTSVFSISVITFIYSASVVICYYTFGLNFINLVSLFYIYAFLTLMFSSKYISYLVALIYLSITYLIIYV